MKTVSTLEEINQLPSRSIIVGPAWDDEVYQKEDSLHWFAIGSPDTWDAESLESRGPFAVLREGEIIDDEERPAILPVQDRPDYTTVHVLRVGALPIGQVNVSHDGTIGVHYAREDLVNQVRTLVREAKD